MSAALPPYVRRVDPRDLKGGHTVSDRNGYYDSQNIVAVGGGLDGVPLTYSVILHHSENREGGPGLQLLSTRSTDRGRTWTALAPVDSPERQSHDGYQLVHRRPDGSERIFLFYGWNEGSHYPTGADPTLTPLQRTDMQLDEGYWIRVSDDHGQTWGSRRYLVPVRRTRIDRDNPWGGATMGMFLCDKPSVIDGAVYMAFQKTREGAGETPGSEAFFLRSPDLLTVDDPADAVWETLPDGDVGLQSPSGELALGEEPHVLQVGDIPGRLFALWRAETGRLAATYSSDGGRTWDPPHWMTYEGLPIGRGGVHELRNPRGSITPFRLRGRTTDGSDGSAEYVMLFYNNGRTDRLGYTGRRVYWLTYGRSTAQGTIRWCQPELALYWDGTGFEDRPDWNPDWAIVDGPGYPDFAELDDGTLVFVESNKLAVRYHEVEPRLLAHLRVQPELVALPTEGCILDLPGEPAALRGPVLPDLRAGGGFTATLHFRSRVAQSSRALVVAFSTVTAALGEEPTTATITKGWSVTVTECGELELFVTDGFGTSLTHTTHAGGSLCDGNEHVVSFIVDGGPKVVSVVVDERLDDGGDVAAQGWAFFPRDLGEVGGAELRIAPDFGGTLHRLVLHDRALLTTEAIAQCRALRH